MSYLDDLLTEAAKWADTASTGDGGERAELELYWDTDHHCWYAHTSSFYDGGGQGKGDTPSEALEACLVELRKHPEREAERKRRRVVSELSLYLRVGNTRAAELLDQIEFTR